MNGKETEKSEHTAEAVDQGDAPVTQSQLNQILNHAMAHFDQRQRETMQNAVHQMQTSLQSLQHNQSTSQPLSSSSSTSTSHPTSTTHSPTMPGIIKLPKPSFFTGAAKSDVETWLFEVEQYLMSYGVTVDAQKVAFAAACLKGLALQWWQYHCTLHSGVNVLNITWNAFKEEMRKRFQPVEASRTARVNLRSLKQGNKTVLEYCGAFYDQLQLIHDMSEADQVENFMAGLNPYRK